jgi:hypothetical protein
VKTDEKIIAEFRTALNNMSIYARSYAITKNAGYREAALEEERRASHVYCYSDLCGADYDSDRFHQMCAEIKAAHELLGTDKGEDA